MALALLQRLNGERAVVLLYIIRILFSTPLSLLPEAFSLSLLSLFALFFEISADDTSNPLANCFMTRPGTSSGILLGAVTVPGLMFSRLIQNLRAFSLQEVGIGGWPIALMSLWVLCHGLVAVKFIQKILDMFPACSSIGESLLVTSGLVIYFGDMLAYTVSKVPVYLASSEALLVRYGIKRSEISTMIQGMIFGLLLFPVFYKYVLRMWEYFSSLSSNGDLGNHEMRRSFVFYASLTFMLVMVVLSWMQLVHSFHVHPWLWVLHFVFSEPLKRLTLCTYWLVMICLSIRRFYNISKNSKTERILLRKYYHLMAVSIFVPALIFQPRFLDLAFGVALAVFLLLVIIRIWKIWPLGSLVHQFMNAFTDHRDSDLLIVSHFSLLLGCALPIWLSSGSTDRPLAPFAGILSLGIGDTTASMVGHKYGVLRWSKTGKKTIEGTAAGITSVLAACFILLPLLAATGYIFTMLSLSLSVSFCGGWVCASVLALEYMLVCPVHGLVFMSAERERQRQIILSLCVILMSVFQIFCFAALVFFDCSSDNQWSVGG